MNSSRNPYVAGSVYEQVYFVNILFIGNIFQLYEKYHDAGFSPFYILNYFMPQAICAIFSMLFNFSLVWITLKFRLIFPLGIIYPFFFSDLL
jgi:hypothetical protein